MDDSKFLTQTLWHAFLLHHNDTQWQLAHSHQHTHTKANKILGALYQLYLHVKTNNIILCTINHLLSEALHGYVKMIMLTTYFGSSLMQGMKCQMHPSEVVETWVKVVLGELMVGLLSHASKPSAMQAFLRWLSHVGRLARKLGLKSLSDLKFHSSMPVQFMLFIAFKS